MTPILLIAGSLHYDIMVDADHLPRRDETAVGRRWYPKFGGKGGNQAVAVARELGRARMLGAVGEDDFGLWLRKSLRAAGVEDRFIATLPGESGMSVAVQDEAGDYAATIVSGANLGITLPPGEALWQDVALVVLQNEMPEATNLAVARAAKARGLPVLLNAAPARTLPEALAVCIDTLVVNAVEAEMMGAGAVRDLSSAAQAAETLALRFPRVVVTAGAAGLAAAAGAERFTLAATPVKVVSTHGAGDAFVGALAARLAQGAGFRSACVAASAAAAAHVSRDQNTSVR